MVIAALICFAVLLVAWVLAPDEATAEQAADLPTVGAEAVPA